MSRLMVRAQLTDEQRAEVCAWLEQLGVDVGRTALQLAITQDGADGPCTLHLTQFVQDAAGRTLLDVATNRPVSQPLTMTVPAGSWPACLGSHRADVEARQ